MPKPPARIVPVSLRRSLWRAFLPDQWIDFNPWTGYLRLRLLPEPQLRKAVRSLGVDFGFAFNPEGPLLTERWIRNRLIRQRRLPPRGMEPS